LIKNSETEGSRTNFIKLNHKKEIEISSIERISTEIGFAFSHPKILLEISGEENLFGIGQ